MSTKHKISEDFYDDSFQLIAIHSGLEDYAMTYAINAMCHLHLKRNAKDLQVDQNLSFSVFDWEDIVNDTYWSLIANKCQVEEIIPSNGLFESNTSYRIDYLVKEQREVDYFLKVDMGNGTLFDQKVKLINGIPKVVTAYELETQTLKSKRNLIF